MYDEMTVHLARVLLLIDRFSVAEDGAVRGLTKLAKLDFLLRYPLFLEALNIRRGIAPELFVEPRAVERLVVDSPMIRYKYGPWDHRYNAILGGLVGRSLVDCGPGKGPVLLRTTARGSEAAETLRSSSDWQQVDLRAEFLHRQYDLTGARLKQLIYETFPALTDLSWGEPIGHSPVDAAS